MRLTQQQLAFFETFGFLAFPDLFVADIGDITTEFERIWSDSGHTHDYQTRSGLIPFSDSLHKMAPRSRYDRTQEVWGVHGNEVPAIPVESTPGDMLLFNHKTNHSSWGGGTRRRMFTYNFEEHMSGEQLPHLVQLVTDSVEAGQVYGEAMLCTASANRMRHLEQRLHIAREEGLA